MEVYLLSKEISMKNKFLIVEANFYEEISDHLRNGARNEFEKLNFEYDIISVPGALEIPTAISIMSEKRNYKGYVALGCVIQGETTHYDIVCNNSSKGLMDLSINKKLAIGNGILNVNNFSQALERAMVNKKNKGGFAAKSAISLASLKNEN